MKKIATLPILFAFLLWCAAGCAGGNVNPSTSPDGILRLAFAPGHYQFQITFLNRVVTGAGSVEVTVIDGKITPVLVTLIPSGTTPVQRQEHSVGRTIKGYAARKNKSINDESVTHQISAVSTAPLPYQPR